MQLPVLILPGEPSPAQRPVFRGAEGHAEALVFPRAAHLEALATLSVSFRPDFVHLYDAVTWGFIKCRS